MTADYRNTISYRRYLNSLSCMIAMLAVYGMIEGLWLGLGSAFRLSTLFYMALYGNIPLGLIASFAVGYAIWTRKQFKKKVADGSIKNDTYAARYTPTVAYGSSGMVMSPFVPAPTDVYLSAEEKKVKGVVMMYPKITMVDLAAKAGVPADQVEPMLLKMVSSGSVKGHVDPGTGEFISGMIDMSRVKPVDDAIFDCPHCGAVMKSAPVKGTSLRCESCGNLIVVK